MSSDMPKRVLQSELADVKYTDFDEIHLVKPGDVNGRAVYRCALVLSTARGEPPRGLFPDPLRRLVVEVEGDVNSGEVARAVKRAFGCEGPPGRPFGWHV